MESRLYVYTLWWPLFCLEFRPSFGRSTFKNRGPDIDWTPDTLIIIWQGEPGSLRIYIYIYIQYISIFTCVFLQGCHLNSHHPIIQRNPSDTEPSWKGLNTRDNRWQRWNTGEDHLAKPRSVSGKSPLLQGNSLKITIYLHSLIPQNRYPGVN